MIIKALHVLGIKDRIPIRFFIVNSILLLILSQMLYSQPDSLIIEHYSLEQGLSNSTIWSIIQDREGYLWFTTGNGVVRYDGYKFQSYVNKSGDTTSFTNDVAWCSYVDKEGTLWFGSGDGLEKFNRRTNNFTNYLPDKFAKGHVIGNIIISILEDRSGIFWVTTSTGVFKFNKISGKFSPVQYDYDSTNGTYTHYNFPFVAKDGSLWFASGQGLDKFNYESGKIVHYWRDPQKREINNDSFSKYFIHSICEDSNGTLWLGTNKGIVEFNKKSNTFTNYLPDASLRNFNNVNRVVALCFDPSGLLWVGTGKGIFTFDTNSKRFAQKFINKSNHVFYYLGNNFITSLYIDPSGALWVGTLSDGIYKVILKKLPYKRYFPGGVHQVLKGKDGILWIVKDLKGKIKFDTRTEQIIPTNFGTNLSIHPDKSGNMYVKNNNSNYLSKVEDGKIIRYNLLKEPGTIYFEETMGIWYGAIQGGGLYFLDFKTGNASEIFNTKTRINVIYKDSQGLVWTATVMGILNCYSTKNKLVSEYISDPKNPSSINGRTFFDIYEDKTGNVWFATDVGLNRFVPSTKTFIHFTEKDGLSGNTVYDILEDDHGNLWLATNQGITKFIPQTNQFKNFDILHGRSYSNWWNRLAVKMDNGEMFFGRSYGLIRFYPDSIKENIYIPPIVITSIKLFDKPVPFGKEINLSYDRNYLSFEFAALSYYNSERNQYAYKLEGVDKDWVYSGTRRYASYPNLEPGRYIFRVKGSNNDGIWNEAGTSISIIISPPWWKTYWAYISYGLILVLILYGIRRYELNRIELKDKVKLDTAVLKEREKMDKIKSRFFANISHEFRTPLTLIKGPAEKIISNTSENIKKDAGLIKKNSTQLLQLVNQLLDLSKLESGKLKLEAAKGNIVSFVKGIALSFESLSEEKDITLKIFSEKDLIEVYFDREKMIKILSNILSNAFKFTQQNGKITVSITESATLPGEVLTNKGVSSQPKADQTSAERVSASSKIPNKSVKIKIRDTGIGILKVEIPKLFDRFYQVDSSFTTEYEGTGIGLALTKELVELHHGSISVESEREKWTEFTLSFPLGRNHLTDEDIVPDEKASKPKGLVSKQDYYFPESIKNKREDEIEADSLKEEKTIVLVVEDNYDMREYIKESLENDYYVEEAVNGEQGVRKAKNIIPDLIISDMMMPKMDGNEMTKILKNDEKTSHIPIIILTAKSGQENKLEGLETGADDYLTKPFDLKELQVRINNLINIRRKLQEKFRSTKYVNTQTEFSSQYDKIKTLKLKGIDEKFINKVLSVIEEHISEESFSVEKLGNDVGMSKAQFYRKLTALTGMPPSIYLRTVRLVKAKKMIEEKQGNISEIAFSVGFSSPSYFAKCFKDEFGYTPSNFIN